MAQSVTTHRTRVARGAGRERGHARVSTPAPSASETHTVMMPGSTRLPDASWRQPRRVAIRRFWRGR